jgi:hypothetical protein
LKVPVHNALWMNMKPALADFGICLNEPSSFGHNMAISVTASVYTGITSDRPASVLESGRVQLLLFL